MLVVRQMQELVVFIYQEVNMRVAEVMTRNVIAVPVDATIAEAAELMKTHNRHRAVTRQSGATGVPPRPSLRGA